MVCCSRCCPQLPDDVSQAVYLGACVPSAAPIQAMASPHAASLLCMHCTRAAPTRGGAPRSACLVSMAQLLLADVQRVWRRMASAFTAGSQGPNSADRRRPGRKTPHPCKPDPSTEYTMHLNRLPKRLPVTGRQLAGHFNTHGLAIRCTLRRLPESHE
jgi:hypothetical protein